ncbi:MAG: DUF86 domain-containing protein [Planctomycetes bacterium]|nr:DUF86 domain-containing protein [Planctomycetota bacterium]
MRTVLIRELLQEMDRNAALLEELGGVPRERFLSDPRIYLLAERCFQLAIECLLDVCYSIASSKRWPKPEEGAEAILLMGKEGVLPQDFAQSIVGMAKFRNVLVHAYLRINREIVREYLDKVGEFRTFARHVERFLDRESRAGER